MNSNGKFLYILDYWVPFPSSEYGGLITLIAENDQDAFHILSNEEQFDDRYGHLMMERIINATKLRLAEEHESGIIDVFCT
jgi:succinate dehydrogenase flavin-adding protein (antitoxin of CptAB toxin-antitoxin module)